MKERINEDDIINAVESIIGKYKNNPNQIIRERNLDDPKSQEFGVNFNSNILTHSVGEFCENRKPVILFAMCPKLLTNNISINSNEYDKWIDENRNVKIKENVINCIPSKKRYDIDSITYYHDYNEKISPYVEFMSNGYIEQGFSFPLLWDIKSNDFSYPVLSLGRMALSLWGFLIFCKSYYDNFEINGDFELIVGIKNAKDLVLIGFGGKTTQGKFAEPYDRFYYAKQPPQTYRENILITTNVTTSMINNEERIVREISDKIANAFDVESARCYGVNGEFNLEHIHNYQWY